MVSFTIVDANEVWKELNARWCSYCQAIHGGSGFDWQEHFTYCALSELEW